MTISCISLFSNAALFCSATSPTVRHFENLVQTGSNMDLFIHSDDEDGTGMHGGPEKPGQGAARFADSPPTGFITATDKPLKIARDAWEMCVRVSPDKMELGSRHPASKELKRIVPRLSLQERRVLAADVMTTLRGEIHNQSQLSALILMRHIGPYLLPVISPDKTLAEKALRIINALKYADPWEISMWTQIYTFAFGNTLHYASIENLIHKGEQWIKNADESGFTFIVQRSLERDFFDNPIIPERRILKLGDRLDVMARECQQRELSYQGFPTVSGHIIISSGEEDKGKAYDTWPTWDPYILAEMLWDQVQDRMNISSASSMSWTIRLKATGDNDSGRQHGPKIFQMNVDGNKWSLNRGTHSDLEKHILVRDVLRARYQKTPGFDYRQAAHNDRDDPIYRDGMGLFTELILYFNYPAPASRGALHFKVDEQKRAIVFTYQDEERGKKREGVWYPSKVQWRSVMLRKRLWRGREPQRRFVESHLRKEIAMAMLRRRLQFAVEAIWYLAILEQSERVRFPFFETMSQDDRDALRELRKQFLDELVWLDEEKTENRPRFYAGRDMMIREREHALFYRAVRGTRRILNLPKLPKEFFSFRPLAV